MRSVITFSSNLASSYELLKLAALLENIQVFINEYIDFDMLK